MTTVKREIRFTIYENYPSKMVYTIERNNGTVIAYINQHVNSVYNYKARNTTVNILYSMIYNSLQTITPQEKNECEFLLSNLVNTQSRDISTVMNDGIEDRINTILPTSLKLKKGDQ